MSWERITIELPVQDENGERPMRDGNGLRRDTEHVPYAPLEDLEIQINEGFTVADRRWLQAMMESLGTAKATSVGYAMDYELTVLAACKRFVRGVKVGETEAKGDEAANGLAAGLEYEHGIVLLSWLLRKTRLESAKKKNWKSLFA